MKHAAGALRALLIRIASATGPEGLFLLLGTTLTAIGASYIHPAGPWFVVGGVALVIGLALALPAAAPPKAG